MRNLRLWTVALMILGGLAYSGEGEALLEYERNTISVFEKSASSVVFITNKAIRRSFFSLNAMEIPQGTGSGFIWDDKGHIVTNYHVIQGANILTVTLEDRSTHKAEVVGVEPSKDLAVLKIDVGAKKLPGLPVGSSDKLKVGQKVLAIGNPFGLDQTLTVGTLSALGREINAINNRTIHNVIQTDAAINPGNSGGPLLDSYGRLIGVNTAIFSPNGANAGIGFAVPVDTVKRIVPQLIKYGKVIRPGMGVSLVDDSIARRFNIVGVMIGRVNPESSAEAAGLRGVAKDRHGNLILGDVIIGVKGIKIRNYDELAYALEQCKVGETVEVEVYRGGKKLKLKVKLQQVN